MPVEIVRARRQDAWGWPVVVNFAAGGAGAGAFIVAIVTSVGDAAFRGDGDPALLVAPALVMLGLLSVSLEAGRPMRARLLLRNTRRAWMSREGWAAAAFLPFSVLACLIGTRALWMASGVAAVGLVLSQGMLMRQARAVPAWSRPLLPLVFLTSSLAGGAGLLLITRASSGGPLERSMLITASACLAGDALAWVGYLLWRHDRASLAATAILRRPMVAGADVGLSRLVPALSLAALAGTAAAPLSQGTWEHGLAMACAAVALLGGVWRQVEVIRMSARLAPITLNLSVGVPRRDEPEAKLHVSQAAG